MQWWVKCLNCCNVFVGNYSIKVLWNTLWRVTSDVLLPLALVMLSYNADVGDPHRKHADTLQEPRHCSWLDHYTPTNY